MKIEERKDEKGLKKIKFKPFDKVRALSGHYCDYPKGSIYNLPRMPGTVIECSAKSVTVDYNGTKSPPVHPDYFEIVEEWKEEKLPKFQVGDFVTADGWSNPNGYEIKKIDDKNYYLPDKYGKLLAYPIGWYDNKLKLVTPTPKSPVVEKTVKSIEPGVYGRFEVDELLVLKIGEPETTTGVSLRFVDIYGNPEGQTHGFTAEELESAAKTFMELAEYLRGRG